MNAEVAQREYRKKRLRPTLAAARNKQASHRSKESESEKERMVKKEKEVEEKRRERKRKDESNKRIIILGHLICLSKYCDGIWVFLAVERIY